LGVIRLSAHKTEEEVALLAINQIALSLKSMAESQKDLCDILQNLADCLSKEKGYFSEESIEK